MALTLNNFIGFETEGLEELDVSLGSPSANNTAPVRSGSGSLKLDGAASRASVEILIDGGAASAGNDHIVGFALFLTDITPTSNIDVLIAVASQNIQMRLRIEATTGDLLFLDNFTDEVGSAAAPFLANTWHFVELYWENLNSGNGEVFVDGTSVITISGQDLFNLAVDRYQFEGPSDAGEDVRIDDIYILTGVSSAADRLGDVEVFKYQSTKNSVTPDDGGADLDAGTWNRAGETPLAATATNPEYIDAAAGAVDSNSTNGSPEGPLNDSRIQGEIKGMKGVSNMRRSGGGGTAHFILMGNNTDGATRSADIDPTTSFANYFFLSESASIVPEPGEYCRIGFETDGAQDYECQEQWAMLLHIPATVAELGIKPPLHDRIFRHHLVR